MKVYLLFTGDFEGEYFEGAYSSPEAAERARQGLRYPDDGYVRKVQLDAGMREWQALLQCFAPYQPPQRKSPLSLAAYAEFMKRMYCASQPLVTQPGMRGLMTIGKS